jgi:hypothetical protein
VVGVVVHGGDASAQHLEAPIIVPHIGQATAVAAGRQRRHLVQHEDLERVAGQLALHQVAG